MSDLQTILDEADAAIEAHRAKWSKRSEAERDDRIETLRDEWDAATTEAEQTDNWDRVAEIEWELEALGYDVDSGN